MAISIPRLASDASPAAVIAALEEAGFVVIEALAASETVAKIAEQLAPYGYYPWPTGFEVEVNVLWAMQDFTTQNGATRVFPGSHAWDDGLELKGVGSTAAECPAGSAIIVLGSCYHGAGANNSDTNRVAFSVGYQRAWLRQGENQYLNCPPDVAAAMPDDVVRLLGYQRFAEALGYWGDGEDPMTAVHPDRTYHVGLGMGPEESNA